MLFSPSFLLQLFLVLTSFASCFSFSQENRILNKPDHVRGPDSRTYRNFANRNSNGGYKLSFPGSLSIQSTVLPRPKNYVRDSPIVVNVDDYGAQANGNDDSEAFKRAWKVACFSTRSAVLVVPKYKTYYLKPVTFSGPCNSNLLMQISGKIKASNKMSDYKRDRRHWLVFTNLKSFRVAGGGVINGNGKIWWQNSCKVNKKLPCKDSPYAVTFDKCENLIVSNLWFKNAQRMHVTFQDSVNVRVMKLLVTAPGNSPNTDGIHVTGTQNIQIRSSVIKTGDDCVSIVSGSKNVEVTDITCGPGHGISIGSLGAGESEAEVSNVFVNRATLSGTTNGVRIKTWQGGFGYAKNVVFQNIAMQNVSNPIIVDQYYCDQEKPCNEQKSAVQVSNVVYRNIVGTSASEVAVKLNCSEAFPCQGIVMQNIDLTREEDEEEEPAKASCSNVNLKDTGRVFPQCSSSGEDN